MCVLYWSETVPPRAHDIIMQPCTLQSSWPLRVRLRCRDDTSSDSRIPELLNDGLLRRIRRYFLQTTLGLASVSSPYSDSRCPFAIFSIGPHRSVSVLPSLRVFCINFGIDFTRRRRLATTIQRWAAVRSRTRRSVVSPLERNLRLRSDFRGWRLEVGARVGRARSRDDVHHRRDTSPLRPAVSHGARERLVG